MTKLPDYRGYRFPHEIIARTVWLYRRFTLSFRDVEDLWPNVVSLSLTRPSVSGAPDLGPTTPGRSRNRWGRGVIGGSSTKWWCRPKVSAGTSGAPLAKTVISAKSWCKSAKIRKRLSVSFERCWARRSNRPLKSPRTNFAVTPQPSVSCCRQYRIAKTGMRTIALKYRTSLLENKKDRCEASGLTVKRSAF